MSPVVVAYLHAVLFTSHPRDKMGLRNSREFQTLAAIADHLIQGHLGAVMDIIMQRWIALEKSVNDQNWNLAKWHELISTGEMPLTSREEDLAAVRVEKWERQVTAKKN